MTDERQVKLFDWGSFEPFPRPIILDTTLRDGIQGLLARYPTLDEKLGLVDLLLAVGIEAFDIGFPIINPKHKYQAIRLARHLARQKPETRLICLARHRLEDVEAVTEVAQAAGVALEVLLFIGSSSIRLLVEEHDLPDLIDSTTQAVDFAIKQGLQVNFACADATRTEPGLLRILYTAAVEHGATRLTVSDIAGVCNSISARRVVSYLRDYVIRQQPIRLDWHGHDDRGLAVANALTAVAAGADCIHTTVLGIGERCGNTALEPVLTNLYYLSGSHYNLEVLPQLANYAAKIFGEPIPARHPLVGPNAYTIAGGAQSETIMKALALGQSELVPQISAGVDPRLAGRQIQVQVGPLSSPANVAWKASQLSIPYSDILARRVLETTSETERIVTDEEIQKIAASLAISENG